MGEAVVASTEWTSDNELIVTIEQKPGRIMRLLGAQESSQQFRGSCTVWHYYPAGGRAGSHWEKYLFGVWKREKWKLNDRQETT